MVGDVEAEEEDHDVGGEGHRALEILVVQDLVAGILDREGDVGGDHNNPSSQRVRLSSAIQPDLHHPSMAYHMV